MLNFKCENDMKAKVSVYLQTKSLNYWYLYQCSNITPKWSKYTPLNVHNFSYKNNILIRKHVVLNYRGISTFVHCRNW